MGVVKEMLARPGSQHTIPCLIPAPMTGDLTGTGASIPADIYMAFI